MTDFHSHILPLMDDGSRSVEESVEMLKLLSDHGVKRVVATPHFYANRESVEDFLKRRKASFDSLKEHLTKELPKIVLGAEVRYYEGIKSLENLSALKIEGTNLLLLEMPFSKWSEYALREVTELACAGSNTIVLAHIERYKAKELDLKLHSLLSCGVLAQINASAFKGYWSRQKALRLVKNHCMHFIGSDAHNLTNRTDNMDIAVSLLKNKFGEEFILELVNFGNGHFM